jgi:hypothetical protein
LYGYGHTARWEKSHDESEVIVAAAGFLLIVSWPISAHHGTAAYDTSKIVTLTAIGCTSSSASIALTKINGAWYHVDRSRSARETLDDNLLLFMLTRELGEIFCSRDYLGFKNFEQ